MGTAIRLTQTGGPDVLKVEPITEARPGPGEVWIEQEAIGVNYCGGSGFLDSGIS
jgi:NADPH2:quinone reductase